MSRHPLKIAKQLNRLLATAHIVNQNVGIEEIACHRISNDRDRVRRALAFSSMKSSGKTSFILPASARKSSIASSSDDTDSSVGIIIATVLPARRTSIDS